MSHDGVPDSSDVVPVMFVDVVFTAMCSFVGASSFFCSFAFFFFSLCNALVLDVVCWIVRVQVSVLVWSMVIGGKLVSSHLHNSRADIH